MSCVANMSNVTFWSLFRGIFVACAIQGIDSILVVLYIHA